MHVWETDELLGLVGLEVPLMEDCEIQAEEEDDEIELDVFRGEAPQLRRLVLSRVSIPWGSSIFTNNLRSLRISLATGLSANAILTILSKTPRLVTMDCSTDDDTVDPDAVPSPSLPVVLDDLSYFSLRTPPRATTLGVLSNIRMPPSVRVAIAAEWVTPAEIAIPLATQLAYALTSNDTRLIINMHGGILRMQVNSPIEQMPLFEVDILSDGAGLQALHTAITNLKTECRPITLYLTDISAFAAGLQALNMLDLILQVMDKLPDLDRLALNAPGENSVAGIIEHLSFPVRRGASPAEWSCPKLESIELHRCQGYEPNKLVRLIQARSGICHLPNESCSHSSEREVRATPIAICRVIIGHGSAMEEEAFLRMEQIVGEGNVHWCWKMKCVHDGLKHPNLAW